MNSTCGYSPVFHSSAPIFDAPGVGCAMVTTPEAMMNRLLFHIQLKGATRSQHVPLADRPRRRKWRIPLPPALWLLATHDLFSFQVS
jgi:hypothetical protein